jgi:hypothetical protein
MHARRPRLGWVCTIQMALKEAGYEALDWMHLAHDGVRWGDLVNAVMNHRVI